MKTSGEKAKFFFLSLLPSCYWPSTFRYITRINKLEILCSQCFRHSSKSLALKLKKCFWKHSNFCFDIVTHARYDFLSAVTTGIIILSDVSPCCVVGTYRRFGETHCLVLKCIYAAPDVYKFLSEVVTSHIHIHVYVHLFVYWYVYLFIYTLPFLIFLLIAEDSLALNILQVQLMNNKLKVLYLEQKTLCT